MISNCPVGVDRELLQQRAEDVVDSGGLRSGQDRIWARYYCLYAVMFRRGSDPRKYARGECGQCAENRFHDGGL